MTITATKALKGEYPEATARYTLYITMKPANKAALVREIKRATGVHGSTVDLNYIDTSDITDMSRLFGNFRNGYELQAFNGDISKWDTSSVENMRNMFSYATAFNQPLNTWTVSSVTNMNSMFYGATAFNQPLDTWDVSKVADMTFMFRGATKFNQNISGWSSKTGRDTLFMFSGATAMQTANKPSWAP